MRFRTKPPSVRIDAQQFSIEDKNVHPPAIGAGATSTTQPYMEIVGSTAAQSLLPMTELEDSTNVGLSRKISNVKKASNDHPPLTAADSSPSSGYKQNYGSIRYFSEKLEAVRRENDELERSLQRESNEFEDSQLDLTKKISELKHELKRKEIESKEQKRKIAELEKHASISQQKKTSREKSMKEKIDSRNKLDEDISQWDREVELFHRNMDKLSSEKSECSEQVATELQIQRQVHYEHVQESKSLEEEIHTIGITMEQLKGTKKRQETDDWQQDTQKLVLKDNNESDKQWDKKVNMLQSRYASAWNQLQHAKVLHGQMQQRIDIYSSSQTNSHQTFPPTPISDDIADRRTFPGHRRIGTNNAETNYPSISTFVGGSPLQINAPKSGSPPDESNYPPSSLPITRPVNRFNLPISQPIEISPESDSFPGGAISPSAGDLLPAGLLGDDVASFNDRSGSQNGASAVANSTLPGLGAAIPGLGAVHSNEQTAFGPASPSTPASGSPSLLSSPQNSSGNIYFATTSDHLEHDRRSIRSTTSSLKCSGSNTLSRASGTRFGNLFGLNRQRGKTLPDSGPAMGTLKPSESQSMPRSENAPLDGNFASRRRGSHSGSGQPIDLLRGDSHPDDGKFESTAHIAAKDGYFRKKAFNMFGSRADPWAPQPIGKRSSSRPSSLGSTDIYYSRPSSQSKQQYGWSFDGNYNRRTDLKQQELALQTTNPWAQGTSRRTSLTGSYALLLESGKARPVKDRAHVQPPIGTRPDNNRMSAPKLNPNAPNFKSLFIREKKSHGAEEVEKEQGDIIGNGREETARHANTSSDGQCSNSDDLREGQAGSSIADTESYSSHELTKHDSIPDSGSNRTPPGNLQGKETFMQKITRKSSANKFTFSNFKNKDGIFSSRPKERSSAINTDLETDEESVDKDGDVILSSSPNADNAGGARVTGISWSSIKRMGKRGDKTPSVTESITSIAGNDDE